MPNVVIQRVDVFELVNFLDTKKSRFIATVLSNIEKEIDPNSEQYTHIRKIVLDGFNDYNRSVVSTVFGDIEK